MDHQTTLFNFAIALLIGALVGIEREKKRTEEGEHGGLGLRSFILLAQAGAVAGWIARQFDNLWIFAVVGLAVIAIILVGYVVHFRLKSDMGLTTEIAGLVVYLLGGLVLLGSRQEAVGLAIVTLAVLAYKQPLHRLVHKLGWDDIFAGLKLLIATFIVLPVLPNRFVDPWGAINPYRMWWLVILISGLSLVGYVLTRWLGSNRGIPLTGLCGGLVSSTAVTLSLSRRSRNETEVSSAPAMAAGVLLAWFVMVIRILVLIAVLYPPLIRAVIVPMTTLGGLTGLIAVVFLLGTWRSAAIEHTMPLRNPFSLASAIKVAAIFTAVLLVIKLAGKYYPGEGVYIVSFIAGLTDVDPIVLSMADFAKQGGILTTAATAITLSAISNTLLKSGLVLAMASRPLKWRIAVAAIIICAGGIGSLYFLRI
jgi:uncharacterized membrane protein (DUF4010 family)